jgi:hypothetical protein
MTAIFKKGKLKVPTTRKCVCTAKSQGRTSHECDVQRSHGSDVYDTYHMARLLNFVVPRRASGVDGKTKEKRHERSRLAASLSTGNAGHTYHHSSSSPPLAKGAGKLPQHFLPCHNCRTASPCRALAHTATTSANVQSTTRPTNATVSTPLQAQAQAVPRSRTVRGTTRARRSSVEKLLAWLH